LTHENEERGNEGENGRGRETRGSRKTAKVQRVGATTLVVHRARLDEWLDASTLRFNSSEEGRKVRGGPTVRPAGSGRPPLTALTAFRAIYTFESVADGDRGLQRRPRRIVGPLYSGH